MYLLLLVDTLSRHGVDLPFDVENVEAAIDSLLHRVLTNPSCDRDVIESLVESQANLSAMLQTAAGTISSSLVISFNVFL